MSIFPTNDSMGNVTYNLDSFEQLADFFRIIGRVLFGIYVVDTVLSLLLNGFLLMLVLGSRQLRHDTRNLLLLNIAVGDLLLALVSQPIRIQEIVQSSLLTFDCWLHIAVQLFHLFAFYVVSVWGVVLLDLLLVLRLARVDVTSVVTSGVTTSGWTWRRRLNRAGVVLAVLLPWLISVVIVAPIVFTGMHAITSEIWMSESCYLAMPSLHSRTLFVIIFILPFLLALILALLAVCIILANRRRVGGMTTVTTAPSSSCPSVTRDPTSSAACQRLSLTPYMLGTFLTFALLVPTPIFAFTFPHEGLHDIKVLMRAVLLDLVFGCMSELKSTVLPIVWILAFADLRARAKHVLTSAIRIITNIKVKLPGDVSVSYRNIQA